MEEGFGRVGDQGCWGEVVLFHFDGHGWFDRLDCLSTCLFCFRLAWWLRYLNVVVR